MKSPIDAAIEGLWSGRRTGDAGSDNTREAEDQSDSNAIYVLSALIQKVLNNGADDNISVTLVQGKTGKFSDRQAAA